MSGKITFTVEQCNISIWGEVFKIGAWFEVSPEGESRVYVQGPVRSLSEAAPIYDYMGYNEDPSFWTKIGFTARDENGARLYWTDDGWRYKEQLPTRLKLLMET